MQTAENERATTENERPTTSLSGGATAENEGATTSLSGGATTSNELNAAVDRREQVAGQIQVLEKLNATDNEAGADYWVGVDSDMSMGPQFIPLVEMKDKNELLDTGDDGDDGGHGGEVGEGGDKDDVGDRGTRGQKKKRKAPKQKKKASAKKQ
ncbi:hypothetical protein LWI28_005542 [Acer negundo]|uniref:Uncharacterized protein n=1 Tax=Acer negundo TaxID=4023 RepID=A0AAD5ID34_ACENE|nr:hypothetical protein LWI28_005542 [Acer negundo]